MNEAHDTATDGGTTSSTAENAESGRTTATTPDGSSNTQNATTGASDDERPRRDAPGGSTPFGTRGAIATADDFRHKRDERGELLPVWERVPGSAKPCPACEGSRRVYLLDGEAHPLGSIPPGFDGDADELDPVECPNCEGSGTVPVYVRVRPLTQGEAERYLPKSGSVDDLDDEGILRLVKDFVVEPDLSDLDSLDDVLAFGLDPLLMAVMNASGFRMTQGIIAENPQLMDVVEKNSRGGS